MTTKTKLAIAAISLLAAYAFGRWSAPEKVRIETHTVTVEKKVEDTDKNAVKKRKKKTVIVETTAPDGTKTKITTIADDTTSDTETKSHETDDTSVVKDKTKEVTYGSAKVTLSALGGMRLGSPLPVYGGLISKPVLGPVTLSAWFLNDRTVGAGIGLTF